MDEPKFILHTTITKKDLKKFFYLATFKRNKLIVPTICLMSFAGSAIISFEKGKFNLPLLLGSWVVLILLSIGTILFKVEKRNAQRVELEQTKGIDSINTLKFYDDRLSLKNNFSDEIGEFAYHQCHALLESKDYFIFYLTANQATLVRKADIADQFDTFQDYLKQKFENKYKKI